MTLGTKPTNTNNPDYFHKVLNEEIAYITDMGVDLRLKHPV